MTTSLQLCLIQLHLHNSICVCAYEHLYIFTYIGIYIYVYIQAYVCLHRCHICLCTLCTLMNGYCYPADIHATTITIAAALPPANRSAFTSAKTTTPSKIHRANRAENPKQLEHKEKQTLITTCIHRNLYTSTRIHIHTHTYVEHLQVDLLGVSTWQTACTFLGYMRTAEVAV